MNRLLTILALTLATLTATAQHTATELNQKGDDYYFGTNGVEKDYEKATDYYRLAAEQGYATAQYNLGNMYKYGLGTGRNYTEAVRWYRKAAEQGNASAQNNLGFCYDNGQGVERDCDEAVRWYRKAADQGYANAQNNLGYSYQHGQGVDKDLAEAVRWYRQAAMQDNATAQYNLGICYANGYGTDKDLAEAVRWIRKAALQDDDTAQNDLGYSYQYGEGVDKDPAEAVRWYRKAADQDNANAQYNLGYMYDYGLGVDKDDSEAMRWYRQAARHGNPTAKARLEKIQRDSTPDPKQEDTPTPTTPKDTPAPATPKDPTASSLSTPQQKRLALVIGNSDYPDGRLANPANDARDMAAKLRELGFDVLPGTTNLDREGMDDQFTAFCQQARDYDVILFFYAGHAVQERGVNYLIPAKDNIPEKSIRHRSTNMNEVMERMEETGVQTRIVILDACRKKMTDGYSGSGEKGMAMMVGTENTFLVFATQPGKEAADGKDEQHSPFTAVLLEEIDKPGVPIYELFHKVKQRVAQRTNQRQIPSEINNLVGDFYFRP